MICLIFGLQIIFGIEVDVIVGIFMSVAEGVLVEEVEIEKVVFLVGEGVSLEEVRIDVEVVEVVDSDRFQLEEIVVVVFSVSVLVKGRFLGDGVGWNALFVGEW